MITIEETYEPETLRVFDRVLKEGDQVIIAGAHQGFFVTYCSKLVGSKGKICGFEPEEENFKILSESVKNLDNVEIFNYALGDRETKTKLYFNSDNDGGHALWNVAENSENIKTKENPKVESIEVKTIDRFFEEGQLDRLKLLMLDAEGAEHSIIKGAINTIVDNDVPYVICEINNFALNKCMTSQISLRNYMIMYGFTPYVMNKEKVVDVGHDEVKAWVPDTNDEVVFNMLFSKRGKV